MTTHHRITRPFFGVFNKLRLFAACLCLAWTTMLLLTSSTNAAVLNPSDPDFVLWLRADMGVLDGSGNGPSDGGFNPNDIATWQDQSGKGNNFTQGTGANRPNYIASEAGLNNQPVLAFDGSNDSLGNGSLNPQTGFTVFAVTQITTEENGFNGYLGGGSGRLAFGHSNDSIAPTSSFTAWTPGASTTYGEAGSRDTEWNLHTYTLPDVDEANWTWLFNGVDTGTPALTAGTPSEYDSGLSVGWTGSGSEYWIGDIAEIIIFDRVLNGSEINEVGALLETRYGLDTAFVAVPEPSTAILIVLGGAACLLRRRRRLPLGPAMVLLFGALLPVAAQGATISTFTGGDLGEGLDLEGTFAYAVDTNGSGSTIVRGLTFTDEAGAPSGYSTSAPTTFNTGTPNYGATADDNALETITPTGRFNSGFGSNFTIDLDDLSPNNTYKLQLIWHEPNLTAVGLREMDVLIEGGLAADDLDLFALGSEPNNGVGVVLTELFTATAGNTVLNIAINDVTNEGFFNALTLERVGAIPEPSTGLLILFGTVVAATRRSNRRRLGQAMRGI